jgi:preprotein translocase subunit SecB
MKKKELTKEFKEKYNNFIHSVELLDLFISELSFKRLGSPPEDRDIPIKVSLRPTKNSYKKIGENIYEITHGVSFKLEIVDENNPKKKSKFFELKAVYKLIYQSELELDDEIFELFSKRNVPINVIPFLRETIHNSMYRAGLPPFLLPIVKFD